MLCEECVRTNIDARIVFFGNKEKQLVYENAQEIVGKI